MTPMPAHTRSRVAVFVVAAVVLLAPWFSSSAQQAELVLRIAMRLKDLPVGQLVVATGQATTGSLTCHGVTLGAPRIFLVSGKEPPEDRQLAYFEQQSSAGRKWEISKKLNDEPCPGPEGVNFYLYEMTTQ